MGRGEEQPTRFPFSVCKLYERSFFCYSHLVVADELPTLEPYFTRSDQFECLKILAEIENLRIPRRFREAVHPTCIKYLSGVYNVLWLI